MSYIRVKAGFVYLSTVIDVYSKKVLGWSVSGRNDTDLVVASIVMALKSGAKPDFIHSDNGYQYTSKRYISWMKEPDIKISKSAPARSLENREIEFLFRSLKREHPYKLKLRNIIDSIFEIYIDWYNNDRIKLIDKENSTWMTPSKNHAKLSC